MIFSIGGCTFNSVDGSGITSMNKTKKGSFTELKLVDGAQSQFIGRALDKLTFNCQWVGENAEDHISSLDKLLDGWHQVSDQDGVNLGLWTIDAITDNGVDIFGSHFACHNVTLSMTEYR